MVSTKTYTTFENFLIKISTNKESSYFMNIYRPPSSSTPAFFEHFQSFLEDIHPTTENLAIIGDFNLHLDTTCSNSKTFHSLINSFDLIQKVNFPTHIHGHTLDQVLTKSSNDNTSNVQQYHTTSSTLIDKHAPLHTKHTKAKYIPGWVNDTVIAAKETKHLFERIWRRDKSTFNRHAESSSI